MTVKLEGTGRFCRTVVVPLLTIPDRHAPIPTLMPITILTRSDVDSGTMRAV